MGLETTDFGIESLLGWRIGGVCAREFSVRCSVLAIKRAYLAFALAGGTFLGFDELGHEESVQEEIVIKRIRHNHEHENELLEASDVRRRVYGVRVGSDAGFQRAGASELDGDVRLTLAGLD